MLIKTLLIIVAVTSFVILMKSLFLFLRTKALPVIDTSPKFGKLVLAKGDGVEAFFYKRLNEGNTFSLYDMSCNLVDQTSFKITDVREVNGEGCFFTPSGKKRSEPFVKTKEIKNEFLVDTKPSNYYLDTVPELEPLKYSEYEKNIPSSDTQPVPTLKENL